LRNVYWNGISKIGKGNVYDFFFENEI